MCFLFFFLHIGPAMLNIFFINIIFLNFFYLFIQHVTYEVEANVFLFLIYIFCTRINKKLFIRPHKLATVFYQVCVVNL